MSDKGLTLEQGGGAGAEGCCTEFDLLEGQSGRGKPVILEALFDMPVSLST